MADGMTSRKKRDRLWEFASRLSIALAARALWAVIAEHVSHI